MIKLRWNTIVPRTIFILAFLLIAFKSDNSQSHYTIPIAAWSVSCTDLDLDGDIDIITGHNYNLFTNWGGISILYNDGTGNFNLSDSLSFFGWQNVLTGQLDNDPHPEIIFNRQMSDIESFGIIYNNNFADSCFLNTLSNKGIDYRTLGDIDGNGLTDIVFCSNTGQFWGVFYNHGYRHFTGPEYHHISNYYPVGIACGDLNGDGRDDIAICGQSSEIYYSTSSGFIKYVLEPNAAKDMISINDFDQDGYNDLFTAINHPLANITYIVLYKNQNNTSLVALPEISVQPKSFRFLVRDFNNDSLPDVAFMTVFPDTSETGNVDKVGGINILYNLGDFQFSEPKFIGLDNYDEGWRNFYSSDLDGNGYNDFAVVRTYYYPLKNNLELLFNDGHGNFVASPLSEPDKLINEKIAFECYPNPFTRTTTIKFSLQKTAVVDLSVYDFNGKLIQRIINKKLKGGYTYSIQWPGSDNPFDFQKKAHLIVSLKLNGQITQTLKLLKL
jgi:hypothetical protein